MLTDVVCRTTSHKRSLTKAAAYSNALASPSSSLLKDRHCQQIRHIRFGIWASCLDPESQNDLRRRHRMLKFRHYEAVNRKPLWDQHPFAGNPKAAAIRHMFLRYWAPARVECGSRYGNQDELHSRQKHTQESPDADHPRRDTSSTPYSWRKYDIWKAQMEDVVNNHWPKQTSERASPANSNLNSSGTQASAEAISREDGHRSEVFSTEDYYIDPITNRKVPRSFASPKDEAESTANTFKNYRAQFQTLTPEEAEQKSSPIHSNGPPPPAELKAYGQSNLDNWLPDDIQSKGQNEASEQSVVQSEEYSLNHLPPDEPADQYDDLHKYQEYHHDKAGEQAQEPVKKYDDLDQYKMDLHYEADNTTLEKTQDAGELHKYQSYMHNENAVDKNDSARYNDLDQYGPYKYQEDVKLEDSSPKYDDLEKYQHYEQDDGKPSHDSVPKYEDLEQYRSVELNDSVAQEQPFEQYGDLDKYKSFRLQEIDNKAALERDIVAESLKEFDAKQEISDSNDTSRASIAHRLEKLDLDDGSYNSDSTLRLSSLQKSGNSSPANHESRDHLEQAMSSHNKASDAADQEASSAVQMSRKRAQGENETVHREMTGHYIKDFPEDFSGSWTSQAPESNVKPQVTSDSEKLWEEKVHIQAAEKQYADNLTDTMNSSKLGTALDRQQAKSRLEPALNRQQTAFSRDSSSGQSASKPELDPYSKEPQGLETSYVEESEGKQTEPAFAKTYGGEPSPTDSASASAEDSNSRVVFSSSEPSYHRDPEVDGVLSSSSFQPATESEANRKPDPIVYKILAYDPVMQKINIAETTSIVPDQASPLTPAEALLRLSNPTKFFPHFAPLQAEGFEILSGGGDVLVFRQVRPGKPANEKATPVNPIDMMGKPTALPNAAAFASPTGFVNYDMPQVDEPQSPPFRSNIDVRREEPVFSGPKSSRSEGAPKQKKKRRLGKRVLVGGAWVAGISYSLGVVSEYFTTGGAEGRGPKGFYT
ncbi:hypothetical protein F5B20DRAFT_535412 [Whalleya microplaca]|nr:hypothetical protein F5B20DRAFT_535412 [Whalleya microplaca]